MMMAPPFARRIPVFVGDDVTDEYGFAAVREMNGRAIHVGTPMGPPTRSCRPRRRPGMAGPARRRHDVSSRLRSSRNHFLPPALSSTFAVYEAL